LLIHVNTDRIQLTTAPIYPTGNKSESQDCVSGVVGTSDSGDDASMPKTWDWGSPAAKTTQALGLNDVASGSPKQGPY
jgi:hypothetical protein